MPSKVEATIDSGVLRLTIPVAETSKPRRIEIAAQSTGAEASQSGRREKVGVTS